VDAARGDRLGALYVVAVTTGMRQGELLALRWSDVDLEARTLRVRATLMETKSGVEFVEPKSLARGGRFRSPQPRRLRSAGTVPGSSRTGRVLGPPRPTTTFCSRARSAVLWMVRT
jgi:integrase